LAPIDDALIESLQKPSGPVVYYFNVFLSALTAIETGVIAPYALFVLGYDAAATAVTYLVLVTAFGSQFPKRFIWRFRPYVLGRAEGRRKDATSSFPSRAVSCSVVYAYAVCWSVAAEGEGLVQWWMPIVLLLSTLLSAFARINLGVHYPSDAVVGFLAGLFYCGVGTALYELNAAGCGSCRPAPHGRCHAKDPSGRPAQPGSVSPFNLESLRHINVAVLLIGLLLSLAIYMVCVVPPIDFWRKCDFVYGMLMPCLLFQVLFLCPTYTSPAHALPPPPSISIWHFMWVLLFSSVAALIGFKLQKLLKYACFVLVFAITLLTMSSWRLWVQ